MSDILPSPRPGPRVFQQFVTQDMIPLRPTLQAAVIAQAFDIVSKASGGFYMGAATVDPIPFPDLMEGAVVDDFSTLYLDEPDLLSEVVVSIADDNGNFDVSDDAELTVSAAGVAIGKALTTYKTMQAPTLVSTAEGGNEVAFPAGVDLIRGGSRVGDTLIFATTVPDLVDTVRGRPSDEVDALSGQATEFLIVAIPSRNVARVALLGVNWGGFIGETNIEAHVRRYPAGQGVLIAQDGDGAGINLTASDEFIPINGNISFLDDPVQPGDEIHFITDSIETVGISAVIVDNVVTPTTGDAGDVGDGILGFDVPIVAGSIFTDADADFVGAGVKAGDELRFITDEADLSGPDGAVVVRNIKRYEVASDPGDPTQLTLLTPLTSEAPPSGKSFQYRVVRVNQPVAVANNMKPFIVKQVKGPLDVILDRAMSVEARTDGREFEFKVVRNHVPNGEISISYRALRSDLTGGYIELGADVSGGMTDLVDKVGRITELNPLGLMAAVACQNTPFSVGCVGVTHMTAEEVAKALEKIGSQSQVYGIALASQDRSLQQLVQGHCDDYSDPNLVNGGERYCVITLRYPPRDVVIATQTSSADDMDVQGTRSHLKLGGGATLDFADVRPGMFFNWDPNGSGRTVAMNVGGAKIQRSRSKIIAVLSNVEVVLDETIHIDQGGTVDVPWSVETHDYTLEEISQNVALTSQGIGDRRVVNLFPADVIMSVDGVIKTLPSYYYAAAVVARRSALTPSQPMTQEPVFGFEGVEYSGAFSEAHFAVMRGGGTWVLEQQAQGPVVAQHQLTTDRTSLQTSEDSIRTAIDYVAKKFRARFKLIAGRYNLTQQFITQIAYPLANGTLIECVNEGVLDSDASVTFVGRDPVFADHLRVNIDAPSLKPVNYPDITLLVT